MNHLIAIQQRADVQDPVTGEVTEVWSDYLPAVPCDISPLSVTAFIQSRAGQSDITVRIKTPYVAGLDRTMRLVGLCECHLDRVYNPEGVLEDNTTGRQHITMPCSEGVNDGA